MDCWGLADCIEVSIVELTCVRWELMGEEKIIESTAA